MRPLAWLLLPLAIASPSKLHGILSASDDSMRTAQGESLFIYASNIFCSSRLKSLNVFYENDTSLSYPGSILKSISSCGISYVVIRNKFRKEPLQILKDDGVLLYLVMVLKNISQLVQLNLMRKKSAAKHLTYVLLLIEDSRTVSEPWLSSTFEEFWRRWLLNVVIMYYQHGAIAMHRYDPSSHRLISRTLALEQAVSWDELYPKRMINFGGAALRMCMYHDDIRSIFLGDGRILGTDGLMSAFLAERLGASAFVDRTFAYENTTNSRDKCFKEIAEELDDVSTNIRFLSLATYYRRVESTVVLSRDDLCVLVPKAKVASPFWNLFGSFSRFVWMSVAASLLLAYGICHLLYRKVFAQHNLFLDLLACLIAAPMGLLHRPSASLRLFLCVWLLYGLLITAAFKANLTGNLVQREFLPDVNTLKDLAESPYPLATLPRHVKHLNRYLDPRNKFEKMLKDKMVSIPDAQFAQLLDASNLSYAYLQKHHVSVFRANARRHSRNGKPLFHVMAQCIVPFHAVYIVPYGSPYLGYINTLMRSAQEFGLLNYWDRKMSAVFQKSRRSTMLPRRNDDLPPVVLTLVHFQASFCLLIAGLFLATLIFSWELASMHATGRSARRRRPWDGHKQTGTT